MSNVETIFWMLNIPQEWIVSSEFHLWFRVEEEVKACQAVFPSHLYSSFPYEV